MKLPKFTIPKINTPRIKIDFNNPDDVKKIAVIIAAVIFIVLLLAYLFIDDRRRQSEIDRGRQIERIATISDTLENTVINYTEEKDTYAIDYPGYKTIDEAELETITWFKENTTLEEVTIIYGGIAGDKRTYDLTKPLSELFQNNPLLNVPDSEPLFDGR